MKKMEQGKLDAIADVLGVASDATGNVVVRCPYHEDNTPSASYSVETGLLNCFTCGRGWSPTTLYDELVEGEGRLESQEERKAVVDDDADPLIFLQSRGLSADLFDSHMRDGYLWFDPDERVGRNLRDDDRPRYINAAGNKGLYWVGEKARDGDTVWLTEGILDAASIKSLVPHYPVAAALGSSISDVQAYELRGNTVFLCFDADHAGYRGARKSEQRLGEYGVNTILLDLPPALGADPNRALQDNPVDFSKWIDKQLAQYRTTDDTYVKRLFGGQIDEEFLTLSTGSGRWDDLLRGGFRPGLHVIGAEPGVGKSSWALSWAKATALAGHRVLMVSYELPKRQMWCRLAATYDGVSWAEIEADPTVIGEEVIAELQQLSTSIRIVAGWSIPQIKYAATAYDAIVVDYIQRMGGPHGGDAKRNVDYVVSELSNLGRDGGKVVLAVSSLNRGSYGQEMGMTGFKESGGVEYVAQSLAGFKRPEGVDKLMVAVVKNTRGATGRFYMTADLAHQRFADSAGVDVEYLNKTLKQQGTPSKSKAEREIRL